MRRHLVRVELTAAEIRRAVRAALAEDLGSGDVTTLATVPVNAKSIAFMNAREPLTVAGLAFAELAFRELSPKIQIKKFARDGQRVKVLIMTVAQTFLSAGSRDFPVPCLELATGKSP